ncbi:DUF4440 domain-containing protein [Novosphingobium taihuense]|uniref:Ketosteroid isomerase-like protein n=1 Tax=Novosphingobium taihuense TaxID=260085 RepID=A0A7W7ETT9_9SPHN|nr:nuclear transport factor 2 family protein [Novosphingobium taihuense]MBB4613713.1 ketosteroid isomerase-like protein [Novosphingobium taihuense]TWH83222.1 uncharacterized protein DUF4440 [Novosphingobium taihuense]
MSTVADAELQVRLRRAAFNRALAEADLPAIGQILSPEAILVTGTDSAVIAGRKAQLQAWKREFSARPRTLYTRSTETIIASAVEPIAMEHGRWSGVAESTKTVLASGTYAAKWRRFGTLWMLVAEIFVTLT